MGLPKSTIVRLLQTLEEEGFVNNDRMQGGYQITSLTESLSCGFQRDPLILEAGRQSMQDLTREVKWPTSIALFDFDAVVVRYSTASSSPLAPFHSTVNMRLSLVSRALGRAYLAFCADAVINDIVGVLARSGNQEDFIARNPKRLWSNIYEIRKKGYAERVVGIKPQTSTLAVPVMFNGEVRASLGVTYFSSVMSRKEAAERLAPSLIATAQKIGQNLAQIMEHAS